MELKLGSIPVRIQLWFLFMVLILGANEHNPAKLGIWVVIVFFSVLVHELGHALVGKSFGLTPRIDLHGMGGTTSWGDSTQRVKIGTGKSIAISLAGPFAGFLFAGVIFGLGLLGLSPKDPLAVHAVGMLLVVNVAWGIFNLLPMLPLDGGNVLRSIFVAVLPKSGVKVARGISIALAVAIALYAVQKSQWWVLYLGVLFAFQNVQAFRAESRITSDNGIVLAIQNAQRALSNQQTGEAIATLGPAIAAAAPSDVRQLGVRLYVGALIQESRWPEATDVITRERDAIVAEDIERYAQKMRELGRDADAERVLTAKGPAELSAFRA